MGICLACNDSNQSASFCTPCGAKLRLQERYIAAKVLGQGAFGKTFLAIDEGKPSRPKCVIKQFIYDDPATKAKALELFDEEAVRLDDLGQHPQIPSLLGHCQHEGRSYLVQEFVDGDNLQVELNRRGAFSEPEVRDVLGQILRILDYIHRLKVIHRDIKPENIMGRRSDQQLVLVDFGAAKYASATALAKTGTTIGSASYAAPEQARGKAIFASDLYSLGVTCLHLVTGVDPFTLFDDLNLGFAWRDFLNGKQVSPDFGKILDKLTQYRPIDRYATAADVLSVMGVNSSQSTIPKTTISIKTAIEYFRNAYEKAEQGDYQGAIAEYTEAIRLKPDYVRAYSARGIALESLGQSEKAKYDFQKAISLVCNTADDYYGRGNARKNLGDTYEAIIDYSEAIRLKPDFVNAYYSRGLAKYNLGNKQGAIIDYNEAIRLKTDFANAYYCRGLAKYDLGDKQGAIADYNEVIRLKPDYAEAYYNRGNAKFVLRDKNGAIANYNEAIRLKPNYAGAYYGRGLVKKERDEKQGALADFRKAAEIYQHQGNTEWYNNSLEKIKELGG
jgi:serine/threonine protein kinase